MEVNEWEVLRYDVLDVHIRVTECPNGVFDPGKIKIDVTMIIFTWPIIEIWQNFFSHIFKDFSNKISVFEHNMMLFKIDL